MGARVRGPRATACAAGCAVRRQKAPATAAEPRRRRSPAPSRRSCSCTKAGFGGPVARLPGAAGGGDRPACADLLAGGPRLARTSRRGSAHRASCMTRPSTCCPSFCAPHGDRAPGARRPQRRRLDRPHPRQRAPRQAGSSCSPRTSSSRISRWPASRRPAPVRDHGPPGSGWGATTATPRRTFRLWNDIWVAPEFRSWNIEDVLASDARRRC